MASLPSQPFPSLLPPLLPFSLPPSFSPWLSFPITHSPSHSFILFSFVANILKAYTTCGAHVSLTVWQEFHFSLLEVFLLLTYHSVIDYLECYEKFLSSLPIFSMSICHRKWIESFYSFIFLSHYLIFDIPF